MPEPDLIERYIRLGLRLGRHLDGLVDAYYGPPEYRSEIDALPPPPPAGLAEQARLLLADLAVDDGLDASRRAWLAAQARGLYGSARKLAGEPIGYLDEIEACYGVRPSFTPEDEFDAAHAALRSALPGSAPLEERLIAWREAQAIDAEKLPSAIASIAEDLRERTSRMFGLPEGEHVDFEMVTGEAWSGFNYYLGGFRSRVAINVDLPVLATNLGHLVAHEAYPGHHTEHSRKEAGLVLRRHQVEETIFLVGTPQCLLAEGLADLGLEIVGGDHPQALVADHLASLKVPYDAEVAEAVSRASEALDRVRGNVAIGLHDQGWDQDRAVAYLRRWALLPEKRAARAVAFSLDPTWRAYVFCYIDGLRLCRRFVGGDPTRFEHLISAQVVPDQLAAA